LEDFLHRERFASRTKKAQVSL